MNVFQRLALIVMANALPAGGWTADFQTPGQSGPSTVMDALRFARQADPAGAAQDRDRFMAETERALDAALQAGAREPNHRLAEGIHALMEAAALGRENRLSEAREDLQSAIVWFTRVAGHPIADPSAEWKPDERGGTGTHSARQQRKEGRMDHFLIDIEEATIKNDNFRKVLFTAEKSQLVLMSLKPGEDIGMETHDLDQFIRVEAGRGTAHLNGKEYAIQDGSALVIPAGTEHNIKNSGNQDALKLYTIYSPPEHKDGTVHRTKQEAETDRDDHYDGRTTAMLEGSQAR